MAIYRNVHLSFWTDNKVIDEFTPEDKYFYLYLLTNPHTNICGCYEISYKSMSDDTGYNKDTIMRLLDRFENVHNVIRFSQETKEILILNWYKYNWNNSSKLISGVRKSAKYIKNEDYKKYVLEVVSKIESEKESTPDRSRSKNRFCNFPQRGMTAGQSKELEKQLLEKGVAN